MVRISRVLAVVVLAAAMLARFAVARADDGPLQPVQQFQDALIAGMKDGAGFDGRRARMQAMVDSAFDLPVVTRAIIGRHHDALSAAEREALALRVKRYAVTTLAVRFARHDGEYFDAPALRAAEAGKARVSGRFVSAGGGTTALDYALLRGPSGWRIVNVWFDGVSGTDIQRAEFEVFLRDGGAERLTHELDALIARLESDAR